MRLVVLALVVVTLSGCAVTPPRVTGIEISRVGVINHLPTVGKDIYIGVTIFNDSSKDIFVDWSFPNAVHAELKRELIARGVEVVDLTSVFTIPVENLSEIGYSLKFGLSEHVVSENAVAELSELVAEKT